MYIYDVYLKKRLTEIDAIITQLTQRDSIFFMYNWIYLLCSIDTGILTYTGTELKMNSDTWLENLAKYVSEKIHNEMSLDADTGIFCETYSGVETNMVLSVDAIKALEKNLIDGNFTLEFDASPLDYHAAYLFDNAEFDTNMLVNISDTLKYSFEALKEEIHLCTHIDSLCGKRIDLDNISLVLDVAPTAIFYLCTIAGYNSVCLFASPLGEYEIKRILPDLESKIILSNSVGENPELTKFLHIESLLNLLIEIPETVLLFIKSTALKMDISCEANAGLKRYRKLAEMDNHPLSDFDKMTLNELDYVIIED